MNGIKINTMLMIGLCTLAACDDWLNVKPQAQIESAELFKSEQGFKDALYGVYTQMTFPALYGREMTFGTVDVLGQMYYSVDIYTYGEVKDYHYEDAKVENLINSIWQNGYTVIANLNNLIGQLKDADRKMFAPDNYNVILGEAYGLRAFLHFDLLRLFGPSYKTGADREAIPYVREYNYHITPLSTVAEVLDYIQADLQQADSLLALSDPLVTRREITAEVDDGYLAQRPFRLNYYATKALGARVALWRGDMENAEKLADEVILAGQFPWTKLDQIATVQEEERDRTFSSEQVFALHVQKLENYSVGYLVGQINAPAFVLNTVSLNRIYPAATHATDWRRLYFWSNVVGGTYDYRNCTKLWQYEEMPAVYACRMPLIRLPELYLISAEAALPANPAKTRQLLNELKQHRGVTWQIPADADPETLRNEILQEYLREFICEGVAFYYYKRVNADKMEGSPYDFDKTKYQLPIPSEEIEYGNRENKKGGTQ